MLNSGVKHTLCLLLLMVPRHLSQLLHHERRTVMIPYSVWWNEWIPSTVPLYPFVRIWRSNPVKFKISSVVSTLDLFSPGPYTPWPNRAEATVRVFKETLHDLCSQIGSAPELKQVTVRELLRKATTVRNSIVTSYGGKPRLNLFSDENRVTMLR